MRFTFGRRRPFNGNPAAKGFELVNPVHVWLVNDRLLILQCHDEEDKGGSVDIDTRYATIINRSLIGNDQRFLDTRDYFEYTVMEAVGGTFS